MPRLLPRASHLATTTTSATIAAAFAQPRLPTQLPPAHVRRAWKISELRRAHHNRVRLRHMLFIGARCPPKLDALDQQGDSSRAAHAIRQRDGYFKRHRRSNRSKVLLLLYALAQFVLQSA